MQSERAVALGPSILAISEAEYLIRKLALATDALAKNFISTERARKELLRVKHGGVSCASFVSYALELAVVLFYVRKLIIKNL
jgi:hypothetical protein